MPGGLLNLKSEGESNIIINGNPSKTYWKAKYAKHTNFGKQNIRLDYEGTPTLRLNEESVFTFKVQRYAELLMDCFVSVDLPTIWSPIMPPNADNGMWAPYEFKWIDYIGATMIKEVKITCGNQTLQEYSGDYILSCVQRDFDKQKLDLFYEMIGHTKDLTDPGNYGSRTNAYPNCMASSSSLGPSPSINGKRLTIPLNAWFMMKTQNALPLISIKNNDVNITITFRPISELFRIRDVVDDTNLFPYVTPNFNKLYMQFYRFLQPPPSVTLDSDTYTDQRVIWNADIHLNCTYVFLSSEEANIFERKEQTYLITQPFRRDFYNITGNNKINLNSTGLIRSWMFYFRRSDVHLRNEWTNYSNWAYDYLPVDIMPAAYWDDLTEQHNPAMNDDNSPTNLFITNEYNPANKKEILELMGIELDGKYRENLLNSEVFNQIEKYSRTKGNAPSGLYCYNFCLDTSPFSLQPSGGMNMTNFKTIYLEFATIKPPRNPFANIQTFCDENGEIVGTVKNGHSIYEYNYDLIVFEEKINMVRFVDGNPSLMFAN